jgi:hypothetical protein
MTTQNNIGTNTLLARRIREIMPPKDADDFMNSPRFGELQAAADAGLPFWIGKTETGAWSFAINHRHAA